MDFQQLSTGSTNTQYVDKVELKFHVQIRHRNISHVTYYVFMNRINAFRGRILRYFTHVL